MAIAATQGRSVNSSVNVASLAFSSITTVTGRDLVLVVVLGSTSSSVSSIGASAGSYAAWTLQASQNGTGVRVEVWTTHVNTGAATVFTVNITGGNTTVSQELEEYSGVSSIGNAGAGNSGSSIDLETALLTLQDGNNFIVGGMGFACQSGDTLTAIAGTSRQSSIPAATAVGGALYDSTSVVICQAETFAKISASRNWAAAAVELRTGGSSVTAIDYAASVAPHQGSNAYWETAIILFSNFELLHTLEPLFAQQQEFPPSPGANNYGFVA